MSRPAGKAARTVLLGSTVELHPGIHGSLVRDPPLGIRYRLIAPDHLFVRHPGHRGRFRPIHEFHAAEAIDPGPGAALVHSARWPVVHRRCWVVDLDDFGYPVLFGRSAANPRQRRWLENGRSTRARGEMLQRAARMLAAYTHPSCRAILFRTAAGVEEARHWLGAIASPSLAAGFLERCHVVPGAHRVLDSTEVRRKWRQDPLRVVLCGRDYWQKNGRLAMEVMTGLARRFPGVRFDYVGEAPLDRTTGAFTAQPNARFRGPLPRSAALRVMASAHVLFHPVRYESFGMVYAEAMAAGLAVVTSSSPLTSQVREFFDPEGAILVPRPRDDSHHEREAFAEALGRLLADRSLAEAMGRCNHRRARTGPLSVGRRNRSLTGIYDAAAASPPRQPLQLDDLLAAESGGRLIRMSALAVARDAESFWRRSKTRPAAALLESPWSAD
jgi:glycosyltransferase involved in cell wall biosynthesis